MSESATMPSASHARLQFLVALRDSLRDQTFVALTLSKYHGPETGLRRLRIRPLTLRGQACLACVYSYPTRDVTKNVPSAEGVDMISELLDSGFRSVHLRTTQLDGELSLSRKGKCAWHDGPVRGGAAPPATHDRVKRRMVDPERPFLSALGVTDEQGRVLPSMSHKWKQINKFMEIFRQAFAASRLPTAPAVRVVDFGSGKGYLTFAIHDYLRETLGDAAQVTGIELRAPLVRFCNRVVGELALEGLHFRQGDLSRYTPEALQVLIALHACDTATDLALEMGIRAGAELMLCAPCCHKEIRGRICCPPVLEPVLKFGIHVGQEAEMLTDAMRALLLEAHGYKTRLFEFVSLEHTRKNKMLLAARHNRPVARDTLLAQLDALKAFYGIRSQFLETRLAQPAAACPTVRTGIDGVP